MNKKQIRCAIYTRKSSEEGLEQDFNSLDAQREACEAYIKSQQNEGWVLVKKQYNDGGFSGGTLERPALKDLFADIEAGDVDIVVVYKVDRLTRSLMDFAKIVDILDNHETSFVSITQQFNTTTSMGRLTLNILLSFAQFEREVTGERIRDKMAASKKKGMWVNGVAPIGYKKENGKLVIDEIHSKTIDSIFHNYLELGSVSSLQKYLKENNIVTKNGKNFSKGHLYKILSNKTYIGKIEHKGNVYDGLHDGIVDFEVFEKVQNLLSKNSIIRKHSTNAKNSSLLAGKLFDSKGNYMSPSHSNKNGKRYRYYISQAYIQNRKKDLGSIIKIPAGEIEKFVKTEIADFVKAPNNLQELFAESNIKKQTEIINTIKNTELSNVFIRKILFKTILDKDKVEILICKNTLIKTIESILYKTDFPKEEKLSDNLISLSKNIKITATANNGSKLIIGGSNEPSFNLPMIQAIVKSFYYHKLYAEDKFTTEMKTSTYIYRLMKLRFLPPKLIEDIINGKQQRDLSLNQLFKMA